jgi:hypothetical protein
LAEAAVPASGAAEATRAWTWRQAALVFALAVLPRLAHWWFVRATPLADQYVPDLSAYLYAASRLLDGAYLFREPMVMSPGYALFLAPLHLLVGPDIGFFVLVNAVLDAGSAALCAGLAARLAAQGPAMVSMVARPCAAPGWPRASCTPCAGRCSFTPCCPWARARPCFACFWA